MPSEYDPAVKALVETSPADWLPLVGRPRRRVSLVNADISSVITGAVDKVLLVHEDPPYVLHLEFQSGHDGAALPGRLKLYNALLEHRHDLLVLSVAIVLRPEADSPRLNGLRQRGFSGKPPLTFLRYEVIRVWRLPVESLLEGGIGVLPLAPLSRVSVPELPRVIRRMHERLNNPKVRRFAPELWAATHVLLGLRFEEEVINALLQGVIGMKESVTYQAIIGQGRAEGRTEGRAKGLAEGRAEGAREFLLYLAEKRLGSPDAAAQTALEAIDDIQVLEALADRLDEVKSWQELLASQTKAGGSRGNGKRKRHS